MMSEAELEVVRAEAVSEVASIHERQNASDEAKERRKKSYHVTRFMQNFPA